MAAKSLASLARAGATPGLDVCFAPAPRMNGSSPACVAPVLPHLPGCGSQSDAASVGAHSLCAFPAPTS